MCVCVCRGEYFVYTDDKQPPEVLQREWKKQDFHYDDVMMAMLTLFAVQTGEGWPTWVSVSLPPDPRAAPHLTTTNSRTNQACARLIFLGMTRLWLIWQFRWLNSDSTHIPNLLTWLNSDSTQNPILITWLNSDSTHLSRGWVNSDSRLITFYLIWQKAVDRGGGGRVRSNEAVGWLILCSL